MRWLLVFFAVLVLAAVWLLKVNSEAVEVTLGAARALFGFFTSPFILEASLATVGLLTVLTYNEYRRKRDDQDEWVILPEETTAEDKSKPPLQ